MTSNKPSPRSPKPQLFAIFIWPDTHNGRIVGWRGELKRLSDGTITYFATWDELVQQIQYYVAEPEAFLQEGLSDHTPHRKSS